jgi:hypothetical protein
MRLTSKDVVGTGLGWLRSSWEPAVINGWQWPLLGDYRAGTVALAVVGFAMCSAASDYSNVRWSHPLVLLASVLGIAALGLIVAGLIWATADLVFLLAAVIARTLVRQHRAARDHATRLRAGLARRFREVVGGPSDRTPLPRATGGSAEAPAMDGRPSSATAIDSVLTPCWRRTCQWR